MPMLYVGLLLHVGDGERALRALGSSNYCWSWV